MPKQDEKPRSLKDLRKKNPYAKNSFNYCSYNEAITDFESLLKEDMEICNTTHEKGDCKWGSCGCCGIPLLHHKLITGEVIHDDVAFKRLKLLKGESSV